MADLNIKFLISGGNLLNSADWICGCELAGLRFARRMRILRASSREIVFVSVIMDDNSMLASKQLLSFGHHIESGSEFPSLAAGLWINAEQALTRIGRTGESQKRCRR